MEEEELYAILRSSIEVYLLTFNKFWKSVHLFGCVYEAGFVPCSDMEKNIG